MLVIRKEIVEPRKGLKACDAKPSSLEGHFQVEPRKGLKELWVVCLVDTYVMLNPEKD
nr:hypothetical protein [Sulfuracidifex tepidarius]